MVQVREEVRGLKGINFRTLLESQPTRMNIIITFMSILELMKIGAITIRQEEIFGEIVIDSLDEIEISEQPGVDRNPGKKPEADKEREIQE